MTQHSIDVTDATFQQEVIEASMQRPVLVDFWAPWCGPCRSLKPVLEKLAQDYAGRFRLAKLNTDENPQTSQTFAVRSIPNVKAFVDGAMVDEFMGALPESQVRAFIERLQPSPAALLRQQAHLSLAAGDSQGALASLQQAVALEPHNDEFLADQADLLLGLKRLDEARGAIGKLSPLAAQNTRIAAIVARVQLTAQAAMAGDDEPALQVRIVQNPDDLDARLQLASQLVQRQAYEAALEHLLEIVRRDRRFGDDAGRRTMLSVFSLMAGRDDLVRRYRQMLAAAMH